MEIQDTPIIELEQDMGIAKIDGTLEPAEKIFDPDVTSLMEGELPVTILSANNATPEETPGLRRSTRVTFQTKPDYIPSMTGKHYETVNNQVECEEILHPDAHIFFCQELIEKVPDVASVIMK